MNQRLVRVRAYCLAVRVVGASTPQNRSYRVWGENRMAYLKIGVYACSQVNTSDPFRLRFAFFPTESLTDCYV